MDATYLSNLIFLINAVSESIIRLLYTGQWIENEEKTEVKFVCNKKDAKPFSSHRGYWNHRPNKFQAEMVYMIVVELGKNNAYTEAIKHEYYKFLLGKTNYKVQIYT